MKTLESIINFEINQVVILNPSNHGVEEVGKYATIQNRKGRVLKIRTTTFLNEDRQQVTVRTGKINVFWEGARSYRVMNYKNLKIV